MLDTCAKNLLFDYSAGLDIYDDEQGRVMSKAEVNEAIRKICFEELGLTKDSTPKQIKRALSSDKATHLFEVIEEIIELKVEKGFEQSSFFEQFVEIKNMKDGDKNEFVATEDTLLTVSKVSGDHHDLTMQRLNVGQSYHVDTAVYSVKTGDNIRLFLTGRKDFSAFIDAVVKAYVDKVETIIATQFTSGVNQIPSTAAITDTGALSTSTKPAFDNMIEKVEAANQCPVIIAGTKTALKNINALAAVNWADPAASVKEAVATTGIIGNYEGTQLMVIPQKFTDKTLATPVVANNKLYVMPLVDNKFIKFVDYGESELTIDEIGAKMDDMQSYEVQRRMGAGTLLSRKIGVWTI